MIIKNEQFYKFLIAKIEKGNKLKSEGNIDDATLQRIDLLENLKNTYDWLLLSPSEKQAKRLLRLAKKRALGEDMSYQLKEIELYSKILEVIPYIKAVNYEINNQSKHLTEDLLAFCDTQLELIDSHLAKRNIVFSSKEEIDEAFKTYLEKIRPGKIPSLKTYNQPEVNCKIEELYQMFTKCAETEQK